MNDNLAALARALPGAFYAGPRKLKHLNDDGREWHVVSVRSSNGRAQEILCRTQDQAEMIAAAAQAGSIRGGE